MVSQRRSQGGEGGEQLTELYREHAAAVYRFAYHLCGRREDAEDIAQFAFLQAHRTLASGAALQHPRAWLMTITKRRWLTHLRDRHDVPVDPCLLDVADGDDAAAEPSEALREVRANLWSLPEQQHQAFVLRHWSGLTHQEIARVLETTPPAVESLLVRARASLVRDRDSGGECTQVRRRLERDRALTATMREHLSSCARCRTARTRLAQVAGIAAALALAPRPHVAEALASTVPGFSAGAAAAAAPATGGAALSGAGGGAGSAAVAGGKLAAALKAAMVVGAAATALTVAHTARPPAASLLFPGRPDAGRAQAAAHTRAPAHSHATGRPSNANHPRPRPAAASSRRGNTRAHGGSAAQGLPSAGGDSGTNGHRSVPGSTGHGPSSAGGGSSHSGRNGGGHNSKG